LVKKLKISALTNKPRLFRLASFNNCVKLWVSSQWRLLLVLEEYYSIYVSWEDHTDMGVCYDELDSSKVYLLWWAGLQQGLFVMMSWTPVRSSCYDELDSSKVCFLWWAGLRQGLIVMMSWTPARSVCIQINLVTPCSCLRPPARSRYLYWSSKIL
jgi:hypothetical protein